MAAPQLNDRLDYLTSYSSQLVFVCSDRIKQQSKVVDSFIAQQNEQADLAILTANELTPLATYREKLYKQLVNINQNADFNRPLNQLLAPLNDQTSSILISIFQAEKLPNTLIKELWDLVLQGRFVNNKHHINVLMMGLSSWAEPAKKRLGAKSKQQPIVLSNHIEYVPAVKSESTELEALIQAKRTEFAQRIKARGQTSYTDTPLFKKWWMLALVGIVFSSTFTGILGWQYPDKINAWLPKFERQGATQNPVTERLNDFESLPLNSTVKTQPSLVEINKTAPQTFYSKDATIQNLLITDWQTASAKLDKNEKSSPLIQSSELTEDFEPLPQVQELVTSSQSRPALPTRSSVTDYQIEDNLEMTTTAKTLDVANKNTTNNKSAFYIGPEELLLIPTDSFIIQIAAMANLSILQKYIEDEQLTEDLWLYKTKRFGGDWYVVLSNQHFSTIQAAREAINQLPDALMLNTPFVKRMAQIKQEIALSAT